MSTQKCLIVDEVLSVGDLPFQQKCIERMKEVVRGGTTVLFVSHNLKTCRRILRSVPAAGEGTDCHDWSDAGRHFYLPQTVFNHTQHGRQVRRGHNLEVQYPK